MGNEIKKDEQINSFKKSNDIVISKSILKKIAIGLLVLICVFLVVTYFNSGLTHKKAKQVFIENRGDQIEDVKILGIKKIKTDTYCVKISFSYKQARYVDAKGEIADMNYFMYSSEEAEDIAKKEGLKKEFLTYTTDVDYTYTKWDTGWFIEPKRNK